MPSLDDITGSSYSTAALTADELNYVRRILRFEAPLAYQVARADVTDAVALLEPEERQEMRAIFESYGAIGDGQTELSGGSDGLKFKAVDERWARRVDVQALLGFPQEPAPPRPTARSPFGTMTITVTETSAWEDEYA